MENKFVKAISIVIIIILAILIGFNIRDVENGDTDRKILSKSVKAGEEYDKKILNDKEKEKIYKNLIENNLLNAMVSIKDFSNSIFSDEEMLKLLPTLEKKAFEKTEDGKYQINQAKIKELSKKYFNREINMSKITNYIADEFVIVEEIKLENTEYKYEGINNISSSDYELVFLDGEQKYSLCFSLRDGEMVYISIEKI